MIPLSHDDWPTLTQVEQGDNFAICKWFTRLPPPSQNDQLAILHALDARFKAIPDSVRQAAQTRLRMEEQRAVTPA